MYDYYLSGKQIEKIAKYIPQVSQKSVDEQNFAGRMMAYSQKIREVSLEAELKLKMETDKGKLIYPNQLKKEIGAKLIYDAICPVAVGTYYGFDPYERKYRSLAAEEGGNSHNRCGQIADIAINIEKQIKRLNDMELQDTQSVKRVLKKCFEGKDDLNSMTEGHSMEILCERIMELIRNVYL